jgi:hypothetical protein
MKTFWTLVFTGGDVKSRTLRLALGVVPMTVRTTAAGPSEDRCWSVWREDDNGNRFEVVKNLLRHEAEEAVRTFEARGHKQSYWMEKTSRT